MYNYFAHAWDADTFNPYADYSIYEHIPWDRFEARGFPDKELLFAQPGLIYVRIRDDAVFIQFLFASLDIRHDRYPHDDQRHKTSHHLAQSGRSRFTAGRTGDEGRRAARDLLAKPSMRVSHG